MNIETFKGVHFWLEIVTQEHTFIIDPAGVTSRGETSPYFGALQNAGDGIRKIYEEGTET